jgi:hypothetical protein
MSVCIPTVPATFVPRPRTATRTVHIPTISLLAIGAVLLALAIASMSRSAPISVTLDQLSAPTGVSISDAFVDRAHGYVTVLGQARNTSSHTMRGAGVLVELLDRQGRVRGVETALFEADTVRPRGSAPFRVYVTDDGTAATCRVSFRQIVPASAR